MARNQPAIQVAVRDAGGVEAMIQLVLDSVQPYGNNKWTFSEGDMQAAQHGAGALWVLAAESQSRAIINEHAEARRLLASLVGGKLGHKAEGNAAGALLMLGDMISKPEDPCSVVTAAIEAMSVV